MNQRELMWIAIAGLVVFFWVGRINARHEGELNQKIKARETVIAALAKQHRTDTLTFTRWKTKYDSLTDTLRITDTLWVKQFIVTADSTITSCTTALNSCESIRRENEALIRDLKKRHSSRFGCVLGAAVTPKGFGPGASCGIKL